jgi:hypothetical protein
MKNTALIITSIAKQNHPVLKHYALNAKKKNIEFIVIGDTKSPKTFILKNCNFYSIKSQNNLDFKLAKFLPTKNYARKNLGYLIAIKNGAEIIIETDDDNIPMKNFWKKRKKIQSAFILKKKGWVNVYKYFTHQHIWPRGFALEKILNNLPNLKKMEMIISPIQQGLADEDPDVDAICRLTQILPVIFRKSKNIALGKDAICPFNSQNTTWFKEAFPLLYLPSHCNFRMTDIWRSFVAQRICWTCGWSILFHSSTVRQERNAHNLIDDFKDEIPGYLNNLTICKSLEKLKLKKGTKNISANMVVCYEKLIELGCVGSEELSLLRAWLNDIKVYNLR